MKETERVEYLLKYYSHLQLARDYEKQENEVKRLNNIIKEAREQLKTLIPMCIMPNNMLIHGTEKAKVIEEVLEILDKGE